MTNTCPFWNKNILVYLSIKASYKSVSIGIMKKIFEMTHGQLFGAINRPIKNVNLWLFQVTGV